MKPNRVHTAAVSRERLLYEKSGLRCSLLRHSRPEKGSEGFLENAANLCEWELRIHSHDHKEHLGSVAVTLMTTKNT
jgi:hypothetical protein